MRIMDAWIPDNWSLLYLAMGFMVITKELLEAGM
jgi:hypothetical protein